MRTLFVAVWLAVLGLVAQPFALAHRLNYGDVTFDKFIRFKGMAEPSVSAAGMAKAYFDSTSKKLYLSVDTGAYVEWSPSGGGAIGGSGTAARLTGFSAGTTIGNAPATFSGNNITLLGALDWTGVAAPSVSAADHVVTYYNTTTDLLNLSTNGNIFRPFGTATVIDVTQYGAKGDVTGANDGVATATSTTFTSASAAFATTDVGKRIRIVGAGAAGVDLNTTIAARNSATSIELTVAASTTVASNARYQYGTDDSAAIAAAIAAAPSGDTAFPGFSTVSGARTARGSVIYFPDTGAKGYGVVTTATVGDKNLTFTSGTVRGARIQGFGASYFVTSSTGQKALWFNGLVFNDIGISEHQTSTSGQKGDYKWTNNLVQGCPDYAVEVNVNSGGAGGVGMFPAEFAHNHVSNCAGGAVYIEQQNSDLWDIHHNYITRNKGVDMLINSTSVYIRWNDFEIRTDPATNNTKPFVQLGPNSTNATGLIQIEGNRFGGETDGTDTPPREAILIGQIDAYDGTTVEQPIRIVQNKFQGSNGTESSTSANSAIRFNRPPANVTIQGNWFDKDYNSNLVHEAYWTVDGTNTTTVADKTWKNRFLENNIERAWDKAIFSAGGVGFETDAGTQPGSAVERGRQNLLEDTDTLSASTWTAGANLTVTKDATGPDGVASSAWTLSYATANSSNSLSNATSSVALDNGLCLSFYAKAGTISEMRAYVQNATDSKFLSSSIQSFKLTTEWQRFSVTVPPVASTTKNITVFLQPSHDAGPTSGTVLVYGPQLEKGLTPSAYTPNFSGATSGAVKALRDQFLSPHRMTQAVRSAAFYSSPQGTTTLAPTEDLMYATPIVLPHTVTVDAIGVWCTTGVASATVRLGIYADRGNGFPGYLLTATNPASVACATSSAACEEDITNLVLPAGIYWLAAVEQVNGSLSTLASVNTPINFTGISAGYSTGNISSNIAGYTHSSVTGNLPAEFTGTATVSNALKVYIKAL